ncbi:hypothetical protein [Neobacillus cucumis]|nr:hypothetical protein [Neobacillus cucumis]MDR4947975.1 hypothetical protein [Neobacillus cucumis]
MAFLKPYEIAGDGPFLAKTIALAQAKLSRWEHFCFIGILVVL